MVLSSVSEQWQSDREPGRSDHPWIKAKMALLAFDDQTGGDLFSSDQAFDLCSQNYQKYHLDQYAQE